MSAEKPGQRVGLIGWPVTHSVSPAMFNAAFAALEMDWRYEAFPVPPQELEHTLDCLREQGVRGLNVTVPHKQAVIPLLDTVQPEAKAVGAVNTITLANDGTARLHGTNTDIVGFLKDLADHVAAPAREGAQALVLGAGGAARAAAYVLARLGYATHIACRNTTRGLELIRDIQAGMATNSAHLPQQSETTQWRMQMRTIPWERIGFVAGEVSLIVNCTPVGMWPDVDQTPWPAETPIPAHAMVYDMVYRPLETRFLQQARAAGCQAISGLGMLVWQGAASFRLWTGREAPLDVMLDAAQQALAT